ncbi:MAG: glutamate racemase [Salibacteraceae bacterium]
MKTAAQPIGIFDSGVGGISVWREVRQLLPYENFLYFADSANCPYGNRSHEEVLKLSEAATRFLLHHGAKTIVVACNTATAAAVKHLRSQFSIRFIGMEPAVKIAAKNTQSRHIAVLATEGTLKGNHFQNTMKRYASDLDIMLQIGHGLVELVEEDRIETPEAKQLLRQYLDPMMHRKVDQIVLGCSHYPFLKPLIETLIPPHVSVIDPAPAVARRLRAVLKEEQLLNRQGDGKTHYFSSGTGKVLQRMVAHITNTTPEVTLLDSLV